MMIPSIDIMGGQAVQLVGGDASCVAVEGGDPNPLATRFGRVGEVAVIDLDAALSRGSKNNAALIQGLLGRAACRVGGGIRTIEQAHHWLDAGAARIILGTAAKPEILRALPCERVIAALDARHGEVVVEGWQKGTGATVVDKLHTLRGLVGGVMVTFVETEGKLSGIDLDAVASLKKSVEDILGPQVTLTVAGGVTSADDVAQIHAMGVEAQVGMALYTGRFDLADALAACLRSDREDGLWPTVVTDEDGRALGLCYSDIESLRHALHTGEGAYHSRRRGLWIKGSSSGAKQVLQGVALDCDADALCFKVVQHGQGFCHHNTATCWGEHSGLPKLEATLAARRMQAPKGSYTARLFGDDKLLTAKLLEEAQELAEAQDPDHVAEEAADLIFFASVALARAQKNWTDVAKVLDQRARLVSRRPGNAKTGAKSTTGVDRKSQDTDA